MTTEEAIKEIGRSYCKACGCELSPETWCHEFSWSPGTTRRYKRVYRLVALSFCFECSPSNPDKKSRAGVLGAMSRWSQVKQTADCKFAKG